MIRVRFPFFAHRERTPEWVVGAITVCWGASAFVDSFADVPRHMMDSAFFAPLTYWMPQRAWGAYAFIVGIVRVAFLVVNGSRPRGSTVLRSIGAGLSATFWFGLAAGAASLPWSSGALWTYGGLCALDLVSLFRAAGEVFPAFARVKAAHGGR